MGSGPCNVEKFADLTRIRLNSSLSLKIGIQFRFIVIWLNYVSWCHKTGISPSKLVKRHGIIPPEPEWNNEVQSLQSAPNRIIMSNLGRFSSFWVFFMGLSWALMGWAFIHQRNFNGTTTGHLHWVGPVRPVAGGGWGGPEHVPARFIQGGDRDWTGFHSHGRIPNW